MCSPILVGCDQDKLLAGQAIPIPVYEHRSILPLIEGHLGRDRHVIERCHVPRFGRTHYDEHETTVCHKVRCIGRQSSINERTLPTPELSQQGVRLGRLVKKDAPSLLASSSKP